MFENGVLRRIFGPKRKEVIGERRKLHNEELNDMYTSPNTVPVIQSRKTKWAEHIASMGRAELFTGFWWGNLREIGHLEDTGVDGRIILRWIFRKRGGGWHGLDWSG